MEHMKTLANPFLASPFGQPILANPFLAQKEVSGQLFDQFWPIQFGQSISCCVVLLCVVCVLFVFCLLCCLLCVCVCVCLCVCVFVCVCVCVCLCVFVCVCVFVCCVLCVVLLCVVVCCCVLLCVVVCCCVMLCVVVCWCWCLFVVVGCVVWTLLTRRRTPLPNRPKFRSFFPLSHPLAVFSLKFGGVFRRPGPSKCARLVSPNVHIRGSRRFKHHQNSTRRHPERDKKERTWRKKREILGPSPFGAPPFRARPFKALTFGPHPVAPHTRSMDLPKLDWPKLATSGWPKRDLPKSVSSSGCATLPELRPHAANRH